MLANRRNFLTVAYHDIFDYPLTESELLRWEVRSGNVDDEVRSGKIKKTGGYYHLEGRSAIVKLRLEREKESAKKLKLARKISTKLSTILTIKFIGVTGSLAMNNAKRESDIDLMFITKSGSLWTTRVAVKIASLIHGFIVRSAGNEEVKNAVCFNMWLDSQHLAIPKKMRNLYSAHEVLQVVPLLNRDHAFERFLTANKWALDYWPNAVTSNKAQVTSKDKNSSFLELVTCHLSLLTEPITYHLQLLYMHRNRTRELVQPGRAFFHPVDWGKIVMKEFDKRTRSS